jgi:hypothetical protein
MPAKTWFDYLPLWALLPVVALMIGGEMVMVAARRGGHRGCHRCAAPARMPAMGRAGCQGRGGARRSCCVMPGWHYAGEGRRPVCMAAIAIGSPISDF